MSTSRRGDADLAPQHEGTAHAPDAHASGHDHDHGGHDHAHGGHGHSDHAEMFRRKFWLSLVLTLPTVVYSHMFQDLLGYTAPMVPAHRWIAPVFGTAVFLYGGPVFLKGGWD
ncbi:MAG TPA: hypothetical protein VFN19_07690, partial [Candidatus Nanopelagicales bacterium]|nr:hypothetical protein [Candidatus Nanopelagicales bacterium]